MTAKAKAISEKGLAITLVRVRPGVPESTTDIHSSKLVAYKCLGHWDLLGFGVVGSIEKAGSVFSELKSTARLKGKVLRSHNEVLYGWDQSLDQSLPSILSLEQWPAYPLVCITFCKLNPMILANTDGASTDAVQEAVDAFHERFQQFREQTNRHVHAAIYGSLSWADLVLLTFGEHYSDLVTAISALTQFPLPTDKSPQSQDRSQHGDLLWKTITIPALRWAWLIEKRQDNKTDILSRRGIDRGVTASLSIGARSGEIANIIRHVRDELGDCLENGREGACFVLGRDDIEFRLRKLTPSAINRILSLRSTFASVAFITHTDLRGVAEPLCPSSPSAAKPFVVPGNIMDEAPARKKYAINITMLKMEDLSVSHRVQGLIRLANRIFADPLTRDMFQDIMPCLQRFAHAIRDGDYLSNDGIMDIEGIAMDCDQLFMLVRHRSQAASALFHLYGGTETAEASVYLKITQSAGAVASSLLSKVGHEWSGAIIVDRHEGFRRLTAHLINLQNSNLFHPQQWWGITHEAGHDFVDAMLMGLLDGDLAETEEQVESCWRNQFPEPREYRPEDRKQTWSLFIEICTELFDLKHAAAGDWHQMIRLSWQYIQRRRYLRAIQDHIFRAFVTFACANSCVDGQLGKPTLDDLKDLFPAFRDALVPLSKDDWLIVLEAPATQERLPKLVESWWPCVQLADRLTGPAVFHFEDSDENRCLSVVESWLRREVPPIASIRPYKDILKLASMKRGKKLTFGSEVAVILTLWAKRQQELGPATEYPWDVE